MDVIIRGAPQDHALGRRNRNICSTALKFSPHWHGTELPSTSGEQIQTGFHRCIHIPASEIVSQLKRRAMKYSSMFETTVPLRTLQKHRNTREGHAKNEKIKRWFWDRWWESVYKSRSEKGSAIDCWMPTLHPDSPSRRGQKVPKWR